MTESIGKPIWSLQLTSAPPDPGEDDDEHEHAAEDVHRVVLHAAGLERPQPRRRPSSQSQARPLTAPSMTLTSTNVHSQLAKPSVAPIGHDGVDLVHVAPC